MEHHLHPDGAWLRLSGPLCSIGSSRRVPVMVRIDHNGSRPFLRRDAGGCFGSFTRQARTSFNTEQGSQFHGLGISPGAARRQRHIAIQNGRPRGSWAGQPCSSNVLWRKRQVRGGLSAGLRTAVSDARASIGKLPRLLYNERRPTLEALTA